jgi:branched-chain amino acid transport system substrate-binding protein
MMVSRNSCTARTRRRSWSGGAAVLVAAVLVAGLCGTTAARAEEIKVGVPLSISGPVAFAGTKMKDAMQLAFDEINSQHFLGSSTLVPVFADDQSSQPQAISVTRQLALRDHVSAIVGYTASNICQAALPVAQELKVPTLQADCVVPGLDDVGDYVYSAVRPSVGYVEQLIDKLVPARHVKTAAILYQRENPVFSNLAKVAQTRFEKNGVQVVDVEVATSGADADFSAQLTKAQAKNPDVLVILLLGGQVGPAMIQARQSGMTKTIFLGEQNFDTVDVRKVAGPNADNSYYPSHWYAGSPVPQNTAYVKAFEARYHFEPDTFSTNGYNAVWLMAQIIKKAGSGDREAIKAAMESMGTMFTPFGTNGETQFEHRMAVLQPFFFVIGKDGKVSLFKD